MIMLSLGCVTASEKENSKMKLKVGDKAPDFKLKDDTGTTRTLSEFKGDDVVLYFYPKNDTPGCTKEACGFRDNYQGYVDNEITVLGISFDSVESHKKFKEKYNLPFILLSDEKKEVAKAYGAVGGLFSMFPKRITFLIDENGKISHIYDKVAVTEHAEEILEVLMKGKENQIREEGNTK